jgi:hypothetical protein
MGHLISGPTGLVSNSKKIRYSVFGVLLGNLPIHPVNSGGTGRLFCFASPGEFDCTHTNDQHSKLKLVKYYDPYLH